MSFLGTDTHHDAQVAIARYLDAADLIALSEVNSSLLKLIRTSTLTQRQLYCHLHGLASTEPRYAADLGTLVDDQENLLAFKPKRLRQLEFPPGTMSARVGDVMMRLGQDGVAHLQRMQDGRRATIMLPMGYAGDNAHAFKDDLMVTLSKKSIKFSRIDYSDQLTDTDVKTAQPHPLAAFPSIKLRGLRDMDRVLRPTLGPGSIICWYVTTDSDSRGLHPCLVIMNWQKGATVRIATPADARAKPLFDTAGNLILRGSPALTASAIRLDLAALLSQHHLHEPKLDCSSRPSYSVGRYSTLAGISGLGSSAEQRSCHLGRHSLILRHELTNCDPRQGGLGMIPPDRVADGPRLLHQVALARCTFPQSSLLEGEFKTRETDPAPQVIIDRRSYMVRTDPDSVVSKTYKPTHHSRSDDYWFSDRIVLVHGYERDGRISLLVLDPDAHRARFSAMRDRTRGALNPDFLQAVRSVSGRTAQITATRDSAPDSLAWDKKSLDLGEELWTLILPNPLQQVTTITLHVEGQMLVIVCTYEDEWGAAADVRQRAWCLDF